MENKAAVLILRSTSRNFPLDLQPELEKAGYHVVLLDSLDDYIASPARQNPYLAILEIGSTTDIDRALIVFEWTEIMHPAAAARFVLLMASKNIALGDSAKKFGAAEVAILPQPTRNLLFKVELHQRLLHAQPAATKRKREGFTVAYAPEETPGSRRVLLIRGQDEKAGKWEDAGLSPSGKVRWRWVKSPDPAAPAAPEGYAWIAEGKKAPEYSPQKQAWAMLGDDDDVVCLHKEKEIFSARKALEPKNKTGAAPAPASSAENTTNLSPRPDSASNERKGNLFTPKPSGEKEDAAHPARAGLGAGEAAAGNSRPGATAAGKTPAANADPASATKPSAANPAGQEAGTGGKALRETPAPAAWNVHQGAAKMGAGKQAVATSAAEETALGVGGNKATETTVPASTVTPPSSFEPPSPESAARKDTERKQALPSTLLNLVKNAGQAPTEKTPEDQIPIPESAPSAEFTLAARPASAPSSSPPPTDPASAPPPMRSKPSREKKNLPSLGEPVPEVEGKTPPDSLFLPPGGNPTLPELEEDKKTTNPAPAPLAPPSNQGGGSPGDSESPFGVARKSRAGNQEQSFSSGNAPADAERNFGRERAGGASESVATTTRTPEELKVRMRGQETPAEENTQIRAEPADPSANEVTRVSGEVSADPGDGRALLKERYYVIMNLAELGDQQSTWHPAGELRIYLPAQQRYFGIKNPAEALPLWIYDGELAPEFIDEMQAWKFYDRPPVKITSLESLPVQVLAEVYRLSGVPLPLEMQTEASAATGAPAAKQAVNTDSSASPGRDYYFREGRRRRGGVFGKLIDVITGIFKK